MSDLCFGFSPALVTSTLTLQHVPTCWDGKQNIELCVLGQLSLLKNQEYGSCVKQMNKGRALGLVLESLGPASGGCLRTIACLVGDCAFSPLPSSSESSLIWPFINKSKNFGLFSSGARNRISTCFSEEMFMWSRGYVVMWINKFLALTGIIFHREWKQG